VLSSYRRINKRSQTADQELTYVLWRYQIAIYQACSIAHDYHVFNRTTELVGEANLHTPTSHFSDEPNSIVCANSVVNLTIVLFGYRSVEALLNSVT